MGTALVVIGILFLLGGLVISLYEAFWESKGKLKKRQDALGGFRDDDTIEITKELIEALKDLLEVFAKLTVGIQVSLIGLLLVYWGLSLL